MNVAGLGIVCARGRGPAALRAALQEGWRAPREHAVPALPGGRCPVYDVEPAVFADKAVLGKMRRAGRFEKLAALAACDAVQDAAIAGWNPAEVGIIVSTALGPHVTTFAFLDGVLDFGEAGVSPTAFSHSVHTAAASYIATALETRGPTVALTHFHFPFHEALRLAAAWLRQGRCRYVLAGAVDELGTVLEFVVGRRLRLASDGRIRPLRFAPQPETVPGEGSAFLLLTLDEDRAAYGRIRAATGPAHTPPAGPAPDLLLADADGLAADETAYAAAAAAAPTASFTPLWGGILSGSALHAAAAAVLLRDGARYASPVPDAAGGVRLAGAGADPALRRVRCLRYNCAGEWATVDLEKGA
jgi:3-oxoacyl-[acyl-carrier-protein] synthase II